MGCGSKSPSQLRPANDDSKSGGGVRDRGERGDRGEMGERGSFQEGEGRSRDITGSLSRAASGEEVVGMGIVGDDLGSSNCDKLTEEIPSFGILLTTLNYILWHFHPY